MKTKSSRQERTAIHHEGRERVVMLSSPFPDITVAESNGFLTSPTVTYDLVSDGLDVGAGARASASAIPDVLQQAERVHQEIFTYHNPSITHQWLGLLCALLLAKGDMLKTQTITLSKSNGSLFQRAVSMNILDRDAQHSLQTITLFLYKTTSVSAPYVPVAFSVNHDRGFRTSKLLYPLLITPAAEISTALDCNLPWYQSSLFADPEHVVQDPKKQTRTRYYFTDPTPALMTPEYFPEANALFDALNKLQQLYPDLAGIIQPFCKNLPHRDINIANPISLRDDIIPGVGGVQTPTYPMYNAEQVKKILSFMTETLCLFQRKEDGKLDETKPPIQNAYYLSIIKSGSKQSKYFEAALPLNTTFADCYLAAGSEAVDASDVGGLSKNSYTASLKHMTLTEHETDGTYTYTLEWTLNGHTVWKRYSIGNNAINNRQMPQHFPILAVWPRADIVQWSNYYIYSRSMRRDNGDITLRVYPGNAEEIDTIERTEAKSNENTHVGVDKVSAFPEIIKVNRKESLEGILILKADNSGIPNTDSPMVIAMDFGTSNTIAYRSNHSVNDLPIPLLLRSYLLPISVEEQDASYYSSEFLPKEDYINDLFISMLRILGKSEYNQTKAITGSIIPFGTNFDLDIKGMQDLVFNLKWGDQQNLASRSHTEAFLKQLLLMYAFVAKMSGCSFIFWRFSWPRAMVKSEFETFKNHIESIIYPDIPSIYHSVSYISEAEAVGDFFTSEQTSNKIDEYGWTRVNTKKGYASIDIGGGSVDISFWQDNQLVAEASLRDIAANAVLCDTITYPSFDKAPRRRLLEDIEKNEKLKPARKAIIRKLRSTLDYSEDLDGDSKKAKKDLFRNIWAMKIDDIADAIKQNVSSASQLPSLNNYLRMIEFYIAAIVFFTAKLMQHAMNNGSSHAGISKNIFSLLFSGNGSQMIKLLYSSQKPAEFRQTDTYMQLCALFKLAMDNKHEAQIIIPINPKHEVAFGMACRALSPDESIIAQQHLMGNTVKSGIKPKAFITTETQIDWTKGSAAERIERVSELFTEFWKCMGVVYEDKINAIAGSLFDYTSVLKSDDVVAFCIEQTNNRFISSLQNNHNEKDSRDLISSFSFVLRQIILEAHE